MALKLLGFRAQLIYNLANLPQGNQGSSQWAPSSCFCASPCPTQLRLSHEGLQDETLYTSAHAPYSQAKLHPSISTTRCIAASCTGPAAPHSMGHHAQGGLMPALTYQSPIKTMLPHESFQ